MSFSIGAAGRIDFQDHADHMLTGSFSWVGWLWISTSANAGAVIATCACGVNSDETAAGNILWQLQLGTKNAGGHRWKLKYLHETGAGVDTAFTTTGEFHANSWAPIIVTRNGTTKVVRIVTPYFDESTTLADLPTTSDTVAHYSIGADDGGNSPLVSSFVQNTMLWSRVLNDSEIGSVLCGYASNSTNFGTTGLLYANNLISAVTTQAGSGGGTATAEAGSGFDSFDLSLTSSGADQTANRTLHLTTAVPTSNSIATGAMNIYTASVSTLNASGLPNPTNCYAEDGTLSTQACAQNNGYINFFDGFNLTAIPGDARVIGAYTRIVRKASTTASGWFTFSGLWASQSNGTGSGQIGSSNTETTEPTTGLVACYRWFTPTKAQVRSGTIAVHAGHGRNGSLTAVTGDIDSVTLTVVWTSDDNAGSGRKGKQKGGISSPISSVVDKGFLSIIVTG